MIERAVLWPGGNKVKRILSEFLKEIDEKPAVLNE
jgi:hypothetical protein